MRVPVSVQVVKGLLALKVLELDNHIGVDLLNGLHEVIHKLLLDLQRGTLLPETEIQRIIEIGHVICATVQDDWERLGGVDACCGSIERQLSNL